MRVGDFFKHAFTEVLDIVIRNVNLSPDDVANLQDVQQRVEALGDQIAETFDDFRDRAYEELKERLEALEALFNDLTNGDDKSPQEKGATTKAGAKK